MTPLLLALVAPLLAGVASLGARRVPEALALAGAGFGLAGSLGLLAAAAAGSSPAILLPGLPGMPLRLEATPLTAIFSLLVATVAACVLGYAVGYMRRDPERPRFFGSMLLFVAAMQALVLAGDWITLLAAWEMIGLASYLLIGFWHGRPGVASAATRAFLYTRCADLGLYLGAFVLIGATGTSEIAVTLGTQGGPALAAGLLLLVAAMGKSAQVPLQDWLQRAMAGPTPVSALLHSATLVAAGAILLIRTAPMLPGGALLAVGIVGGVTALATGLTALAERDLKRLLAASTSSQYGLMFVAVGAGAPVAALLHLIAHAAIKSALFLAAGVFQHDRDSTALDVLAGAGRARPGIFAAAAVAALALAGIPPLAGFYSKEAILAATLASPSAAWLTPMTLAGSVLTGAYLGRMLRVLWSGVPGPARPPAPWMAAGLGALTTLAAGLGAGFGPLEEILGARFVPAGPAVLSLGLAAGAGGLVLGWLVPPLRLLGPLAGPARRNFAVAGGANGLMLRPARILASACGRIDEGLLALAYAIGRSALRLAGASRRTDEGLLALTYAIGRSALWLAGASRRTDETGIDGVVFGIAREAIALGVRARRMQSGLIHRELAVTTVGIALIVAMLLAIPILF